MKKKEGKFDNLIEKIFDLVAITDFTGNFSWVGKSHEVLGYNLAELIGKNVLELIHPQDLPYIRKEFIKLVSGEIEQTKVVFRYQKADGSYIWLETIGQIINGEQGIIFSSRDVTPYFEKQQALNLTLKYYNDFIEDIFKPIDYQQLADDLANNFNSLAVAINIYEEDGSFFTTKALGVKGKILDKAVKILGMTVIGKKWEHDNVRAEKIKNSTTTIFQNLEDLTGDVIPREIIRILQNTFNIGEVAVVKVMKGNKMFGDFTVIMPKGVNFTNKAVAEIFANQLGLLLERQQKEIERLKMEKVLKESEYKYRNIFNHSPVGIFHFNKEGIITDCNKAFIEILGSSRERLIGFPIFNIKNQGVIDGVKKVLAGENSYFEGIYTSVTNNKSIYVFAKFAPIYTDNREIIGGMGIVEDMTKRKIMEDMLHFEK